MESLLRAYIQRNDVLLQSQAILIKNLELQLGQLASDLSGISRGSLPSNMKCQARIMKSQTRGWITSCEMSNTAKRPTRQRA
ncbi:hypothetical protein E5676_scaffold388G00190 [Cucumis melo var. makuwa]|uniref:Uncharacterized protein n=1 Tax=Cucumis melo var. makuwa TaxID=1194695 RepID=A0A5D3BRV1_CUCMM|nr:hypothetical protein E5676_scaffold388G00190 [Cucumis melo var. makuwa]